MTAHLHSTVVPGCYRCELGQDEYREALLEQIHEAAADYREADEALTELEGEARRMRIDEAAIREAHGLWLR